MSIDFAKLHNDVVFGKAGGKIIWQPRIGAWFNDRKFFHIPFPHPYADMDLPDIYRSLGCSARIYDYRFSFKRIEHPEVKESIRQLSDTDFEKTITTPAGKQTVVLRNTPNSDVPIHLKREVATEDELKVSAWRELNTNWQWDQDEFDRLCAKWKGLGAATMYIPRMNVQDLYLSKMGVEKGIYAIMDWPKTVEAYFEALEICHDKLIELINKSPINILNFGENIHAGTIGEDLFLKYHLPACRRRCDKLHKAGKFISSHWDGDTKPLLKYLSQTGLDGIEAITPKPQGDVTLEEIKEALPDGMVMMDGIPAILFDDMFPEEMLIEYTKKCIELFAPRLVLGISDEISSTGNLERIRIVGQIVNEYNSQFD
ncbi:MAG: uroporphyrinogen decarboxylase family protein [Phycisphaerae bacterium]|jgi:hypothetical protein